MPKFRQNRESSNYHIFYTCIMVRYILILIEVQIVLKNKSITTSLHNFHPSFYFSILVLAARYVYYNSWSLVSGQNSQYKRLPHRENSTHEKIVDSKEPSSADILWCLTKLGIVLAYFYVSDRTNFLLKENK